MTEAANPELVAEIVEEIVARRGDAPLLSIGQRTAGIVSRTTRPSWWTRCSSGAADASVRARRRVAVEGRVESRREQLERHRHAEHRGL